MVESKVRYEPLMVGTINTAFISISNDDCDENPYTFNVMGESQESLDQSEFTLRDQLKIYPNPNHGIFELKYEGVAPIVEVNLYNVIGKRLNKKDLLPLDHTFTFKINHTTGLYFLEVITAQHRTLKKIIIH